MDKEPLIQFIEQTLPIPRATVERIADQFEDGVFAKNEYFVRAGKVSNDYLFLTDGVMRAFTLDTDGNEVTTGFYAKNRVVFEVSSFFMRRISDENIQALTDCRGFILTFDKLNQLFHAMPEFREFGRAMLAREFAAFKQRTLALINQSAEERYADLIRTNREVFQSAQLKQIASYLGITDTSLSRIRREYAKKG
ncbi:Crp/Fnr family transcriptional regulator [Fibrisoma montanum]|uniref:Crp/Fnr family transcriptional regulator n=1 Tax=Fibrisoma montanum TaxID=2305895 RepID=A0A418MC82_9BACT|nr:Crp/Fnr family transcriptional regulator [Fibrisoma montanum]RIV23992.1 Crp/Fnr family transcriptional regulator [Fibrisoma montanum]